MHLVDTSIWIDFLRNKDSEATDFLETLIESGDLGINEVILNEICIGAKDIHQFKKYKKYFEEIPVYLIADWAIPLADLRFRLRKKGITTYLPDSLIAFTALSHNLTLVTKDKDFLPWEKIMNMKLLLI